MYFVLSTKAAVFVGLEGVLLIPHSQCQNEVSGHVMLVTGDERKYAYLRKGCHCPCSQPCREKEMGKVKRGGTLESGSSCSYQAEGGREGGRQGELER